MTSKEHKAWQDWNHLAMIAISQGEPDAVEEYQPAENADHHTIRHCISMLAAYLELERVPTGRKGDRDD